jgi:hypothetical protein
VQLGFNLSMVHPAKVADPTPGYVTLRVASYLATVVFYLATILASGVIEAATCLAASRVHLGEEVTLREALVRYLPKIGRLVGLGILMGLYACWPLFITAIVAGVIAVAFHSIYATVPAFILAFLPSIYLYTRCALAYPVVAIENLTASGAFSRSIKLGEGSRWRICWGLILPMALVMTFSFGTAGLIQHFKTSVPILAENPIAVAGLEGIVSLLLALVFTPLSGIVLTVLYYDQRMRNEGYDIERMMDSAGMSTPVVALGEAKIEATPAEEGQA